MTSSRDRNTEHQDAGQRRKQAQKSPTEATGPVPGVGGEAAPLVEGLGGDFGQAAFQRHAALLGDPRMSHPANARQRAQVVRQLQRDYGNQYVQRVAERVKKEMSATEAPDCLLQVSAQTAQRDDDSVVTGEPVEVTGDVTVLGPDVPPEVVDHVDESIRELERGWGALVGNYEKGVGLFETYMSFPSEAEARADYMGAAFKFAGEQVLSVAVDQIKKKIPGFDVAVGFVKAMEAERERAAKAAGLVKVRDFIVDYQLEVAKLNTEFQKNVGNLKPRILQEFQKRASRGSPELATPTTTSEPTTRKAIAGPAAAYLNEVREAATSWKSSIDSQYSAPAYLQKALEKWVQTREGEVESKGGGAVYMGGRIYVNVNVEKDGDDWALDMPKTGKLAAPEAGKAADGLEKVMKEQGITTNDLDILKVLTLNIEDEVWGFNDHYRVILHYRKPDQITYQTCIPSPVNEETVEKAPKILAEATSLIDPKRLGVTELEAY